VHDVREQRKDLVKAKRQRAKGNEIRLFHLDRRFHPPPGAACMPNKRPKLCKRTKILLGTQVVSHIWAATDSAGGTGSVSQTSSWFGKREGAPSQPMGLLSAGHNLGAYRLPSRLRANVINASRLAYELEHGSAALPYHSMVASHLRNGGFLERW
jgi:hypothetical protein